MKNKVTWMRQVVSVAFVAWLGASVMGAMAADGVVIDPAARMQDEMRRAERLAPPATSLPRLAPGAPLSLPEAPMLAGRVLLNEVVFSPSQLLEESDLRHVAKSYLGRQVTSQDLNAFLREIQALYLGKGIETAVPVLPQQDLRSGSLRVLLVEGKLGAIRIEGATRADAAWLGQWFDFALGSVIRPAALEQRLNLFNAASDHGAQGRFVPGSAFGLSDLAIQVQDTLSSQVWGVADVPDLRSAHVTGSSLTAGYRLYPLGSRGGRLDAMAILNPTGATLSVAAGLPLGHQGWRLGASATASRSRSKIASTEVGTPDLVIDGESSSMALELAHHQAITARQLLRVAGTLSQLKSRSTVGGETLSDRVVDRFTLAASMDWPAELAGHAPTASLRAAVTAARGPANPYSFAEVWGSTTIRLAESGGPVLRLNGQARLGARNAPDATDVWLAGGSQSVRGFDTGAVTGERGRALQMALHQSVAVRGLDAAEVYLFSDLARAVKNGVASRIASSGVGFLCQLAPQVTLDAALTRQTAGFQGDPTRFSLRVNAVW